MSLLAYFFAKGSEPLAAPHRIAADILSVPVISQPELVFTHSIGNVHITGGADGQVIIKEKKNGFTDAIQIHYQQNGDRISIIVDIQSGLLEDTWVDFDVSIPSQAGVIATLENGGTLEADGLSGQIALSNTNGSIWATNLNGAITLKTESGSMNAKHVNSQMRLITQNGTITTDDVHVRGRSTVQAESGTINFHGSLGPKGSYLFEDGNGAVSLTLSRGAAFHVDARTTSGAIETDFPGVIVQHQRSSGENRSSEAHGNVGTPPLAGLTIQTTSGPINLYQGG